MPRGGCWAPTAFGLSHGALLSGTTHWELVSQAKLLLGMGQSLGLGLGSSFGCLGLSQPQLGLGLLGHCNFVPVCVSPAYAHANSDQELWGWFHIGIVSEHHMNTLLGVRCALCIMSTFVLRIWNIYILSIGWIAYSCRTRS